MSVINEHYYCARRNIALVNLVEPSEDAPSKGSKLKYKYKATRCYYPSEGCIRDKVVEFARGTNIPVRRGELWFADWLRLPALDLSTKQLVGKNKERYCTIISVRVYAYGETSYRSTLEYNGKRLRVLGYTFMDINGDKVYKTVQQIRESDILEHTHSVDIESTSGMYYSQVSNSARAVRKLRPDMEADDTDTTCEDTEIAEIRMLKTLVGGWYTKSSDGVLEVDLESLREMQVEELEVPEGILCIPEYAFGSRSRSGIGVKRIKLPNTLRQICSAAFNGLTSLESINIPPTVKSLGAALFSHCGKFKELDVSHIPMLGASLYSVRAEHLILPDTPNSATLGNAKVDVLEFRNMTGAKRRVLKATQSTTHSGGKLEVQRIETNGPVVLGNYNTWVVCRDVSALEPNIVGIGVGSTFMKSVADKLIAPWLLGGNVEFIYDAVNGYQFTDDAYKQGNLKAVTYSARAPVIDMPKSVELLEGKLPYEMAKQEYPNVRYAVCGLIVTRDYEMYRTDTVGWATKLRLNMPSLRWVFPPNKVVTLQHVHSVEKSLMKDMPRLCAELRDALSIMSIDVFNEADMHDLKCKLLYSCDANSQFGWVFKRFRMIYVGDYAEILCGGH